MTGAGVGSVVAWRLNEDVRAETELAYRQARDSEERFKSAFENAPIGMALASVQPGEFGRYLQVNAAMAALTGYSQDQLLTMSGPEITHPDDVAAGIEVSRQMVERRAGERDARQALHPRRRQDHLGAREHLARPRRGAATRSTPWCRCRT